jgi:hypothetical protein
MQQGFDEVKGLFKDEDQQCTPLAPMARWPKRALDDHNPGVACCLVSGYNR